MNLLSVFFAIPSIYLLLLFVIFLILLVETVYLLKKRGKASSANPTIVGLTSPPPAQSVNPMSPNTPVNNPMGISPASKKFPWKIAIPLTAIALVVIIILVATTFLKQAAPQQEQRGRAAGNVTLVQWRNNCSPNSDPSPLHPQDPQCRGSHASTDVVVMNNSGSSLTIQVRKQQFSCDTGVSGTTVCGQNAKDNKSTVIVPPNQPFDLGTVGSDSPSSSCGSAQVDIFFTTDLNPNTNNWGTPYWGFAWTGSNCTIPPTHIPTPTVTPPGPTAKPTITPPGPTATPTVTPAISVTPIAAMCVNVKFYSVDLNANPANLFINQLSSNDLKNLRPGDKINITVLGNIGSDKGRIRVNGSGWQELIQRRPSPNNNEFFDPNPNDLYQIPLTGTMTFTVEGQVHDASGWH